MSRNTGRNGHHNGPVVAADAVAALSELMAVHGGGLELVGLSQAGVAKVRFTGMCQGCLFRPLTMAATIRPIMMRLESVTEVEADGARISDEALERITRLMRDKFFNSVDPASEN